MNWAQLIPTVLSGGSLITAAAMVLRVRAQNRKDQAETGKTDVDASSVITEAALSLLDPFKQEVAELRNQVSDLSTRLSQSQNKANSLDRQVRGLVAEVTELRDENNRYRELHGPLPA